MQDQVVGKASSSHPSVIVFSSIVSLSTALSSLLSLPGTSQKSVYFAICKFGLRLILLYLTIKMLTKDQEQYLNGNFKNGALLLKICSLITNLITRGIKRK